MADIWYTPSTVPPVYDPHYIIEGYQPATTFAAGLALIAPFLNSAKASIGLMLTGAFGLGATQLDAKGQLGAALSAAISWNPAAAIVANAQVGLSLATLIPSINASIVAGLQLKIGGIQLLMNLGLGLIAQIPPLVASLTGFLQLPGGYFGLYYGPAASMRPMSNIATLVGGGSGGNVAAMVMVFGTNGGAFTQAQFATSIGGLFATHP